MVHIIKCLTRFKRELGAQKDIIWREILSRWYKNYKVKPNKIIFGSFDGKGFGDNPKYIAKEIIRQGLDYDMVWTVKDLNTQMPSSIRKVKWGTAKEAYEFSTAKVIVCNHKNAKPFIKKQGQYYIQTWHANFPLKYVEQEASDKLSKRYAKVSKRDSDMTDVMLSSSSINSEIMHKSFWYKGEVWECGCPRDDIFFNVSSNDIKSIKNKFGINDDKKILLYAPTFRDDKDISVYNIDFELINETLQKKTGDNWVTIIRLHPNVPQQKVVINYCDTIINGSLYPDPQDLVLIADIMISDFSSIMIDCGIMRKPVFLYIPDIDKYKDNRDVRPVYYELPFPKSYTINELQKEIMEFDEEKYQEALSDFIEKKYRFFSYGHSSQKVVERIVSVINNEYGK